MRWGFSLVELSIVLVILGLLTGGILAGQSLIRAAELRSVTTQYQSYLTAAQTFRDKYFALPGDMSNAQSFWGVAHATAADCVTTPSTSTATCNGNGDGRVMPSDGSNEPFRFWQHLANAGLIEGTYDGIAHGSYNYSANQQNSPQGRLATSLWFTSHWGLGPSTVFTMPYGNFLEFGAAIADGDPLGAIFRPAELWNIDTKLDDGRPAAGRLVMRGSFANCTDGSSATSYDANYRLSNNALACAAVFRQVF